MIYGLIRVKEETKMKFEDMVSEIEAKEEVVSVKETTKGDNDNGVFFVRRVSIWTKKDDIIQEHAHVIMDDKNGNCFWYNGKPEVLRPVPEARSQVDYSAQVKTKVSDAVDVKISEVKEGEFVKADIIRRTQEGLVEEKGVLVDLK